MFVSFEDILFYIIPLYSGVHIYFVVE